MLTTCRHWHWLVPRCITFKASLVADLCQAHWLLLHFCGCMHLQSASAFCIDVFEISHKTALSSAHAACLNTDDIRDNVLGPQ